MRTREGDGAMERDAESKLYEGKAKIVYATGEPGVLRIEFKDDATAFNGAKRATIAGKGELNREISALAFEELEAHGIPTHFLGRLERRSMRVRRLEMIPVEVVVRNVVAGSLAQRLGRPEGEALARPVVEFFLKDDALGDPWINATHAEALGLASAGEMRQAEALALRVDEVLVPWLLERGLRLIDFKLEFGRDAGGALVLGDEVTPDTCRFWDAATGERLDKDRFRRDLGDVTGAYREVLRRLEEARA
ncbi:MAG: phosphoribosylaminoimidazolesuccinocarboxamide synthase [Bacillota bacterium]|nr:phosphoribosylaminoimidazolesuccinocarboxamide synthase [Bacillota bacterium]